MIFNGIGLNSMVLRITFSNEPIGAYEVLCCKSCSQAGAQKGLSKAKNLRRMKMVECDGARKPGPYQADEIRISHSNARALSLSVNT